MLKANSLVIPAKTGIHLDWKFLTGWIPAFAGMTIILLLSILLTSCATTTRTKDGPPPYDVDVSRIPNAVPQHVRLTKIGNARSYRVFGRNYYVMRSARNYDQVGVASWYGTKFHSRYTSSGERYNMLAMTAAHKSLPLPTYVEVTNLKNKRKIIVKVNDRGPFENNRLIDLSYVAAKKLGIVGHGTAWVRVRTVTPDDYQHDYHRPTLLAHNVYLQVGAFKNRSNAEQLKLRLIRVVSSPVYVTHFAVRSPQLYHVRIGPIKDMATADHINQRLRGMGLKGKTVG